MKFDRISNDAIKTLDRVGLGGALNEIAALLDSADGRGKHSDRGWFDIMMPELHSKAYRHLKDAECDDAVDHDSGMLASLHAAARCLMIAQRQILWRDL